MERKKYLKKIMLVFVLVSIAAITRVNAKVLDDAGRPQDVRLYLKLTQNTNLNEKKYNSEDEKRIWNVILSADELLWQVNESTADEYYYVWSAETCKYSRVIVKTSNDLADNKISKIVNITNKSNFDVTPSITISNQNADGLFSATYNNESIAWNATKSASITIDTSVLKNKAGLASDNLIITDAKNKDAYIMGNAAISLAGGPIYAFDYNQSWLHIVWCNEIYCYV